MSINQISSDSSFNKLSSFIKPEKEASSHQIESNPKDKEDSASVSGLEASAALRAMGVQTPNISNLV